MKLGCIGSFSALAIAKWVIGLACIIMRLDICIFPDMCIKLEKRINLAPLKTGAKNLSAFAVLEEKTKTI